MKKFFSITLLSAIVFSSASVFASDSSGLIVGPLVQEGIFMFAAGTHNKKPACSTVGDAWAFDANNSAGRSMQALIMLAYALGKSVTVIGSGDCKAWGDRERPAYVYVN